MYSITLVSLQIACFTKITNVGYRTLTIEFNLGLQITMDNNDLLHLSTNNLHFKKKKKENV